MKTKNTELLKQISRQNYITENQILLLKHRLQKQFFENKKDEIEELENFMFKNNFEILITCEQCDKGFKYLKKTYFTNYGYLRTNQKIKFKYEVLDILKKWYDGIYKNGRFKFCGFAKISNGIMTFIEPIYKFECEYFNQIEGFQYFHFNGIDYEYEKDKYLKGNSILYISGRI